LKGVDKRADADWHSIHKVTNERSEVLLGSKDEGHPGSLPGVIYKLHAMRHKKGAQEKVMGGEAI